MSADCTFFLCPTCFEASEVERTDHPHRMIRCNPGTPGDERRKPVMNGKGAVKTHAPRWFLEAVGAQRREVRIRSVSALA
jgi:hypothetical protein